MAKHEPHTFVFNESYQFTTLAELRDWLNQFKSTDLDAVWIECNDKDYINLRYITHRLSDGSEVTDAVMS